MQYVHTFLNREPDIPLLHTATSLTNNLDQYMCNTYDALIIIKNHVLIECCKCESETE